MLQKLKNMVVLTLAMLSLASFCLVGTAAAVTTNQNFACSDNSTDISRTPNTKTHELVVKCASNAKIIYINNNANTTVTIPVTCPGGESIGSSVDKPNSPTASYTFYCVNLIGTQGQYQRTNSTPTSTGDVTAQAPKAIGYTDPAATGGPCRSAQKCDLIDKYINPLINFMAALVGLAVVISIIVGGIQYASSADDPQKVTQAKARIRNAIIALVAFLFLYALLQFLVPGGIG